MNAIKGLFKFTTVFLLILSILCSFPLNVSAEEDLTIPRWLINSEIMENGDLRIVEDITFSFNSYFNGVFRQVLLNGTDGIDNIKVSELVKGNEVNYVQTDDAKKGDSNVYMLNEDDESINIQIFSPSEDEQKTFRISYTVKNVCVKYNDTGELYYKFLGKENETPIDFFEINIKLPGNITEKVKIFAHGPNNGTINFSDNNTIRAEVENVPQDTFVEVKALFPKEFIPGSNNVVNKDAFDKIMDEELSYIQEIKEKEIKRKEIKTILSSISVILSGLMAFVVAIVFNKYRRKVNIYEAMDNNPCPDDNSPAIIAKVLNGVISTQTLIATIFDLARRGFISIKDEGEYKKKLNNFKLTRVVKSSDSLLKHEKHLLEWLFDEIGNGESVESKDIEYYGKHNSIDFYKGYNKWVQIISEEAKELGYYDNTAKAKGIFLLVISIIAFVISIITMVYESYYGIILMFMSIFSFVYSIIFLTRKSDYGYVQTEKWKDFKKDLKQRCKTLDIRDLAYSLDKALIYGLALGIDFKSLKNFKTLTPESTMPNYWMYWFFLTNSRGENSFEKSINKSFEHTGASTGSGGGFSAGGGGGAGGGGAGGF